MYSRRALDAVSVRVAGVWERYSPAPPSFASITVTEGVPQYAGVIVLSMAGIPLGFGRANHSTDQVRDLDPTAIAVLHLGDIGEYLRLETTE